MHLTTRREMVWRRPRVPTRLGHRTRVCLVNYVLHGHAVLFRTDEGSKLDAALRGARVAFQIDGAHPASRTGWSVLVRAEAVEVVDSADLAQVRELPLYPWAPGAKSHYVRLLPALLTGRRIAVPDDAASNWFG
jgi:uncharacterized protein